MESRLKRIFHRKKNPSSEQALHQSRNSAAATSSPALQTSHHDSATAGGVPHTGSHPIKGNNSSGAMPKRKSSLPDHGHQRPLPEAPPLQDFSALSLEDAKVSTSPTQPQSSHHGHSISLGSHREGGAPNQINPNATTFNQETHWQTYQPPPNVADGASEPYSIHSASFGSRNDNYVPDTPGGLVDNPKKHPPYPKAPIYGSLSRSQPQNESDLAKKNSIPRKQLGDFTKGQPSRVQPSFQRDHNPSANMAYPVQLDPAAFYDGPQLEDRRTTPPAPGVLDRSRPISRGPGAANTAERVVERAKSNTINTEVIESFAPAVVHETVYQDIHHIREEVITREIHTHDVYHRILPVIDVEVLPPRHFLPVEGGGLVEISGSEVPGRGQNWVIAETASKIPSDQHAPMVNNRFSAREFVGNEGDSKRYITPEGCERTEETWVHPPELESGGRDTGQTWPMVFGEDGAETVAGIHSPSKPSKKKSLRKGSLTSSSTVQQTDKA